MKKNLFFLTLMCFGISPAFAQPVTKADDVLRDIAFYADVMVNADHPDHRRKAHEIFYSTFTALLSSPGSYDIALESIKWISILKAEKFRIITWQLKVSDEEYVYGGFIQWPDKVKELKDNRPWLNGSLRTIYTPDSWYGALYYRIIPFQEGTNEHYILFGFHAENSLINRKVADILDLSGEEPVFGKPLFHGEGDPQMRLILTYADASNVQLFYDPDLTAIVHDHLDNLPGVGPQGQTLAVSDGSQEAWILKDGHWIYMEKVYDIKSDTPPMTNERKERKEDKDILGRPKKN